tara:strand:- start:110 stop:328 length:219 start_codon:yes stop_codon:yes gene_type:complete
MITTLDPGQQIATANFVLALAGAFTFGLPILLILGNRSKINKTIDTLTADELAYEIEMFGWIEEANTNYLES